MRALCSAISFELPRDDSTEIREAVRREAMAATAAWTESALTREQDWARCSPRAEVGGRIPSLEGLVEGVEEGGGSLDLYVRAVLLLAYVVYKASDGGSVGARVRAMNRLSKICDLGVPESSAAHWLLGRMQLRLGAVPDVPGLNARGILLAGCGNLLKIRAAELRHPTLLPGLVQEYPDDMIRAAASIGADTAVTTVLVPFRYQAASRIMLATGTDFKNRDRLARAALCSEEFAGSGRKAPIAELGCELASLSAMAFMDAGDRSRMRIDRRIEVVYGELDVLRSNGLVSWENSEEWRSLASALAAVNAGRAGALSGTRTHLAAMKHHLRELIGLRGGNRAALPDYLWNDPPYLAAFELEGSDAFKEFVDGLPA